MRESNKRFLKYMEQNLIKQKRNINISTFTVRDFHTNLLAVSRKIDKNSPSL